LLLVEKKGTGVGLGVFAACGRLLMIDSNN
jgi:hypothetical protein